MAGIGLRKPYIAEYVNTDGVVSYAKGRLLAKAIEFSASIDAAEDNNLYADDGIAESDRSFSGGTVEITTDDLESDASAMILGIQEKQITVDGDEVTELVYDDDMEAPNLGFGVIIPKKVNGVMKYRAVILHKIKFNIPDEAATTQGESIEWKTPSLSSVVMRDDTPKRGWKSEVTVDSAEKAEKYIKQKLNIA